jgi:hypothetical protein
MRIRRPNFATAHVGRIWFCALLVAGGATPAHTQDITPTEIEKRLGGCYALVLGSWVENPGSRPPTYEIPREIELTLLPTRTGMRTREWQLRPPIAALDRPRSPWPSWRLTGTDSLRLVWSTGFEFLVATVQLPDSTGASGYAETGGDAVIVQRLPDGTVSRPPRSRAPVRLDRRQCSTGLGQQQPYDPFWPRMLRARSASGSPPVSTIPTSSTVGTRLNEGGSRSGANVR